MNPLALIPYALAAYGGIQGYQGARQQGVGGLGSLVRGALGAYGGYSLGSAGMGMFPGSAATKAFAGMDLTKTISKIPGISQIPMKPTIPGNPEIAKRMGMTTSGDVIGGATQKSGSLLDLLRKKGKPDEYDPMKIALAAGGIPLIMGAFDQGPVDVYTPGYNTNYLETREKRSYSYIDPVTGQEKEYEKVYIPEQNPNRSTYQMQTTRLRTGGLAEIKKFNEGGINYLPSKMTHDENDANNYVRASGYVEDGAGVGDKDEDTMLAQLADGEFVTRADGVLGAGIIAGANPNSMKDMREKGAAYFYEQQKRYKRVFDLLKEANGNSKQKTN